ncbi:MAG: hypothetical protein IPG23_17615 [Burkholderiales bacterium]|nr:hypothetical protein [Burkholderiales bacterium]
MASAGEIINGSLRLIGALAEGEVPSAETSADALMAMNQMIDSWNTERLMIYNTIDQQFTWPSDEITQTLGPTGDFVGLRPVALDDSTYYRDASTGVSYGIKIINQQQYNGIAVKTVTSTYPQVMWINMENPDIAMTIYPKPTRGAGWHFISVQELAQPATLATELAFPPGYLRAFRYNLAREIAAEFGIEPPRTVSQIANVSKRNLKSQNGPGEIRLSIP